MESTQQLSSSCLVMLTNPHKASNGRRLVKCADYKSCFLNVNRRKADLTLDVRYCICSYTGKQHELETIANEAVALVGRIFFSLLRQVELYGSYKLVFSLEPSFLSADDAKGFGVDTIGENELPIHAKNELKCLVDKAVDRELKLPAGDRTAVTRSLRVVDYPARVASSTACDGTLPATRKRYRIDDTDEGRPFFMDIFINKHIISHVIVTMSYIYSQQTNLP